MIKELTKIRFDRDIERSHSPNIAAEIPYDAAASVNAIQKYCILSHSVVTAWLSKIVFNVFL